VINENGGKKNNKNSNWDENQTFKTPVTFGVRQNMTLILQNIIQSKT